MPAFDVHKNFAYSTVATAPSPASSGTSLVVAAGEGVKFPAVSFNATVWPANVAPTSANAEVVRVTGIATDTLTIARTQESSSARTIIVGDQIANTQTNKAFTDIESAAKQRSTSLTFTPGMFLERFTVSDSDVTASSLINGTIIRPDQTELTDTGVVFTHNVTRRASGVFDLLVSVNDGGDLASPSTGYTTVTEKHLGLTLIPASDLESFTTSSATFMKAFSFLAPASGVIYSVVLYLTKTGTPTDNFVAEIRSDNSDAPGTVLSSGTIPGTIPNDPAQTPWNFSGSGGTWPTRPFSLMFAIPPTVVSGTKYWINLYRSGATDGSNYVAVQYDSGAGYAGGTQKSSTNGGSTWGGASSVDYIFEIPVTVPTLNETVQFAYHVY